MELYVYVQMGGKREAIDVQLLDGSESIANSLHNFDAAKAKCSSDEDTQRAAMRSLLNMSKHECMAEHLILTWQLCSTVCQDHDESCKGWAKEKQCEENKAYMFHQIF